MTLRRDGETDEEAFDRVKSSRYIIDFRHDDYWPFYDVKHKFGRVIMTINTAHPFFTELYTPVSKMSGPSADPEDEGGVSLPESQEANRRSGVVAPIACQDAKPPCQHGRGREDPPRLHAAGVVGDVSVQMVS